MDMAQSTQLQFKPVPSSCGFDPVTGEINDSLTGDFLWSSTNFGEAVTAPMTPLSWTVLQFTLDDWVFLPGYSTTGNIGGRPYLNISVFASLFNALGRSREDLLKTMEGTLYMRLPEELEIPLIAVSARELLTAMAAQARMRLKHQRGMRYLPTYVATNPDRCQRIRERIWAADSGPGLAILWQDVIRPHVKRGVWAVLGVVEHSTNYTVRLRRDLITAIGPEDASALIANVGHEDGLLPSLGPVVGLAQVAQDKMAREDYLARYGHRGPHEFELAVPRPAEDPGWLERQLAQLRASPVDAQTLVAQQREAFDAAWQRLRAQYPRQANTLRRRVAESAARARRREEARSEYVRDRWLVRTFALATGELTGLGDDVFYLTLEEVLDVLSGDETAMQHIAARRQAHLRYKAMPAYPPIIRGRFDPFHWAADPHLRSDFFDALAPLPASAHADGGLDVIIGSPGAAGRVEGVVRRLDNAEQGDQLRQGEVLVTMMTDVAWTLLFPRARAVVTDLGAPLSHAAIVARELGIPAVVGCGDATMRLKTGDRVRVDGARGTVEVVAAGAARAA